MLTRKAMVGEEGVPVENIPQLGDPYNSPMQDTPETDCQNRHNPEEFGKHLLTWFADHGRKELPWSMSKEPYHVWVSEIMLQQTQLATVLPYFADFIARFPTLQSLALASADEVLARWSGLGYYARARNLHRAAQIICKQHQGLLPDKMEDLEKLPGIGRSTAAAILAFSYGQRQTILDANVRRVLSRVYRISSPTRASTDKLLWEAAEWHTPHTELASYTQAIMDLGALVCSPSKPACEICPVSGFCHAYQTGDQDAYPTKFKSRGKPLRHIGMLLIYNDAGGIYLERRPPYGIWGGLWSLPECDPELRIGEEHRLDDSGMKLLPLESCQSVQHSFTHYDLRIVPIIATLIVNQFHIAEAADCVWYSARLERDLGMASPIQKLLKRYTGYKAKAEQGKCEI